MMIFNRRNAVLVVQMVMCCSFAFMANSFRLSLDSCRVLAVENNNEIHKSEAEMQVATFNRKAAFTHYLPKISAVFICIQRRNYRY